MCTNIGFSGKQKGHLMGKGHTNASTTFNELFLAHLKYLGACFSIFSKHLPQLFIIRFRCVIGKFIQ